MPNDILFIVELTSIAWSIFGSFSFYSFRFMFLCCDVVIVYDPWSRPYILLGHVNPCFSVGIWTEPSRLKWRISVTNCKWLWSNQLVVLVRQEHGGYGFDAQVNVSFPPHGEATLRVSTLYMKVEELDIPNDLSGLSLIAKWRKEWLWFWQVAKISSSIM